MGKPKGVKLGNPINNFDEIWQGIVSRKLDGMPCPGPRAERPPARPS